MKVLPDYLIQYMPELEDALEELRLSVIDHAYELLKCLDIDELSSDDIRHKLELYSLKLENMTSDWLPNGRFYRMYSSIKHHRTRYNAIQSIVKSGGQFEGVWSSDFNEKQQYNYRLIQLLRHYQMQSPMDGYFYISGDATRRANGSISGSTLTALSTDALLAQALPAGYTYIYVPWPRPYYPGDVHYFYNIHMLQFDRFHYAEDCNKPYGDNGNVYSTSEPASQRYFDEVTKMQPPYWFDYHYTGNPSTWPVQEVGIYKDEDGNTIAKITVSKAGNAMYAPHNNGDSIGWKRTKDSAEIEYINNHAVEYILDDKSRVISDPKDPLVTNCFLHARYRFSPPNRSQIFTPIERSVIIDRSSIQQSEDDLFKKFLTDTFNISEDRADYIAGGSSEYIAIPLKIEDCTPSYLEWLEVTLDEHSLEGEDNLKFSYEIHKNSIDENCLTEPDLAFSPKASAYKFDRLTSGLLCRYSERLNHIKTYRPVADVSSPIFAMMQSAYNSTTDATDPVGWGNSSHSLYYWMNLKQRENRPEISLNPGDDKPPYSGVIPNAYYSDAFVGDNRPSVSKETFTSYDRHTTSPLDPIYMALFYPEPNSGGSEVQGDDYTLSNIANDNLLYYYNEDIAVPYDPTLSYTIVNFGRNEGSATFDKDILSYITGHPAAAYISPETGNEYKKSVLINKNNQSHADSSDYNYITYKTSKIHKLWFSANKHDTSLNKTAGRDEHILYNDAGSYKHYIYTNEYDNLTTLQYTVLGVYDENNNKLDYDVSLQCPIINGEYFLHYNISDNFTAAYVLFIVNVLPEPTEIIADERFSHDIWFNHAAIAREIVNLGTVEYEYIEPAISGGTYNSDQFEVDSDLAGGDYYSDDFNVYSPVTGGSYDSDQFVVVSDIEGGNYNSEQFEIISDIAGGSYDSDNFNVTSDITGGNYDSDPFAIISDVLGGEYNSDNFNVYSDILGGDYNSSQFAIISEIAGGNYESDNFNVVSDIDGGNYNSDSFAIETYISTGGSYITNGLDVVLNEGISGGSYVTSGLDVALDTGIDGGSYATDGLDVEQRND